MHELLEHTTPYFAYITHGVLAVFGALVHASKAHQDGTTKNPVDLLAIVFMSSFSGVMFALVGLEFFGHGSYVTLAMAGAGGYVGVEGMSFILMYLGKKFGIKSLEK